MTAPPLFTARHRIRAATSDAIRQRALERLYQRKAIVDELIDSLENYQRSRTGTRRGGINAARKCS